jgi:hypothetical protein
MMSCQKRAYTHGMRILWEYKNLLHRKPPGRLTLHSPRVSAPRFFLHTFQREIKIWGPLRMFVKNRGAPVRGQQLEGHYLSREKHSVGGNELPSWRICPFRAQWRRDVSSQAIQQIGSMLIMQQKSDMSGSHKAFGHSML